MSTGKTPRAIDRCRCCGGARLESIISLGTQCLTGVFPRSPEERLTSGPLELVRCAGESGCGLVQLRHTYDSSEMYGQNYGYRSGLNQTMVRHLDATARGIIARYPVRDGDIVLDVGSNDGTTLSFMPAGARRVGMDPTIAKYGHHYDPAIEAIPEFFSARTFREHFGDARAEVITCIAMFYDLEDPLAFVRDIAAVLSPTGVWYFEQSYLPTMLTETAYDTICHEHLEYYALKQVRWLLDQCGLRIIDVSLNMVNGGSFSVTACHEGASHRPNRAAIDLVAAQEKAAALDTPAPYEAFAARVAAHRDELLATLASIRSSGKTILGYGASTKGNVILQYCGLTADDIPAMAEVNVDKLGSYTPGTNIPIISEGEAHARNPDYLLVMPWHFRENLVQREQSFLERGGRLLFPLPQIAVVEAEHSRV